jgi:hypothetical protein
MDCLRYLLDLIDDGKNLELFYNGDHVYGVNEDSLIYDYNFDLRGYEYNYLPIEKCHTKEVLKRIFNLDEYYSKILDNYYVSENRKT